MKFKPLSLGRSIWAAKDSHNEATISESSPYLALKSQKVFVSTKDLTQSKVKFIPDPLLLLKQQCQKLTRWWSLACVGFSLEEERLMQHRSSKYFPQFENQGINPVRESRQVQSTCTNPKELAPNAINGLSIPSILIAKWDLKAESATKKKCKAENMVWSRPGAIVFTRGFSQNSKYYGGWTNYWRAIDRTAQSHDDI